MKTKILVLGKTGMLGHMVYKELSKKKTFNVAGTHIDDKRDLFYFNIEAGLEKLNLIYKKSKSFDYFINCIGVTSDKINKKDSKSIKRAKRINSRFPHQLAEFAKNRNLRVIHISTDGVFSNTAKSCEEDAPKDCKDIYGKTKSLGEVTNNKHFLNIRCSILGPSPFEKGGLLEWFSSQPNKSTIYGYTDHLWNGVTTLQFAELCYKIIRKNCFDSIIRESSVHHFCPNKPTTKFRLLKLFKSLLKKRIRILPKKNKKTTVKRILTTKYKSLKKIFGYNKRIDSVVKKLFENL